MSLVGIAAVAQAAPASAAIIDTTAPNFIKWGLSIECRVQTGFSYNVYTPDSPKFAYGWRTFQPVKKKKISLREVTSRVNPTPTEEAAIDEATASCLAWLETALPTIIKKTCKQAEKLGTDLRLEITSYSQPTESCVVDNQTQAPKKFIVPSIFSYYNLNYGVVLTKNFDSTKDCEGY